MTSKEQAILPLIRTSFGLGTTTYSSGEALMPVGYYGLRLEAPKPTFRRTSDDH